MDAWFNNTLSELRPKYLKLTFKLKIITIIYSTDFFLCEKFDGQKSFHKFYESASTTGIYYVARFDFLAYALKF